MCGGGSLKSYGGGASLYPGGGSPYPGGGWGYPGSAGGAEGTTWFWLYCPCGYPCVGSICPEYWPPGG